MYLAPYRISHDLGSFPHRCLPLHLSPFALPLPLPRPPPPQSLPPSHPLDTVPSCSRHLLANQSPGLRAGPLREVQNRAPRCDVLHYRILPLFGKYALISSKIPALLQCLSPEVGYYHIPSTPSYEVRGFYSLYIYLGGGWGYVNGVFLLYYIPHNFCSL